MRYLLIILGLFSSIMPEDLYPFYTDPKKQIEFEEKKIIIIEESGKEQYFTGGDSYTELANTWGHILFDEDPDYVVKQTPIKTHYEYYYTFKIKQGKKELSEIDFLLFAGYNDKVKEIFKDYNKEMDNYNVQYDKYEKELQFFNLNNEKIDHIRSVSGEDTPITEGLYTIAGWSAGICLFLCGWVIASEGYVSDEFIEVWGYSGISTLGFGLLGLISSTIPGTETYQVNSIKYPELPLKPKITQVFSNEQIKSLAEAYNRRLYNEIKNSQ